MFGERLYLKACAGLTLIAFLFLLSGCAAAEYEVKTEVEPEGSGQVVGSGTYTEGEVVTVKAEPADGYKFEKWIEGGDALGTDQIYEFQFKEDRNACKRNNIENSRHCGIRSTKLEGVFCLGRKNLYSQL